MTRVHFRFLICTIALAYGTQGCSPPANARELNIATSIRAARNTAEEHLRMLRDSTQQQSIPRNVRGEFPLQKIVAQDGQAYDTFGSAVAIDGTTAVVGATQNSNPDGSAGPGAVFVFENEGGIWSEKQMLVADDGADFDQFGFSVALRGDLMVVGAPQATVGGHLAAGAVYIFERSANTWTLAAKVDASESASDQAVFGSSVATDGSTVAVGSPFDVGDGNTQGAAYVFDDQGGSWFEYAKVTSDDGQFGDAFGVSVAMDTSNLIVGASQVVNGGSDECVVGYAGGCDGAVYLFEAGSGAWSQIQRLTDDDETGAYFGQTLAFDGAHLVVAAPAAQIDGHTFEGAGYAYAFEDSQFSSAHKLVAADGGVDTAIGWSSSISNGIAVLSTPFGRLDGDDFGQRVWLFSGQPDETWVPSGEVFDPGTFDNGFGSAASIASGIMIIGALAENAGSSVGQGAAYIIDIRIDKIFADGFD